MKKMETFMNWKLIAFMIERNCKIKVIIKRYSKVKSVRVDVKHSSCNDKKFTFSRGYSNSCFFNYHLLAGMAG